MRFYHSFHHPSAAARKAAALILSVALAALSTQCASLSPQERGLREVAVGRALSARFARSEGILKNSTATSYLSLVGRGIVDAAGQSNKDFHFAILDTNKEIAVAGPGGYVLISKGYIRSLDSEAELAAVLAREIAHIALNHFDDSVFTSGSRIETSESGSEELYEMIQSGSRPAAQVEEADAAAALYLSSLGYDPSAVVRILGKGIPQKNAPPVSERKSKVESMIKENGLGGNQTNVARFKASTRGL